MFYLSVIKYDFRIKLPGKREGSSVWKRINPLLQANTFPVNTHRKRWEREKRPPWLVSGGVAVPGAEWGLAMAGLSLAFGQPLDPGAGGCPRREELEGQGVQSPTPSCF